MLFSLYSYSKIESLNDAIAAIKNNPDDEEFAGYLGLNAKVLTALNDSLTRSARMQLEINMSHNNLIFHNNSHELSVNEISEIVTKKCKGLVDNLISKEVFERLQLEARLAALAQKVLLKANEEGWEFVDTIIFSDTSFGIPTNPRTSKKKNFTILKIRFVKLVMSGILTYERTRMTSQSNLRIWDLAWIQKPMYFVNINIAHLCNPITTYYFWMLSLRA